MSSAFASDLIQKKKKEAKKKSASALLRSDEIGTHSRGAEQRLNT
jgi:hypothetical protein